MFFSGLGLSIGLGGTDHYLKGGYGRVFLVLLLFCLKDGIKDKPIAPSTCETSLRSLALAVAPLLRAAVFSAFDGNLAFQVSSSPNRCISPPMHHIRRSTSAP